MKIIQFLTIFIIAFGAFGLAADAQTRKTPVRRPIAKRTPLLIKTPARKPAVTAVMILTKEKVSNQRSNVNRFIDVLGPIAQTIETVEGDVRNRRVSKTLIDKNVANKQKVIQAIRNLRTGLVNLETDFRTKPDLKKFLVNIQGISDLSAQAEDSALANKFVASKEPLRLVAIKLTDTLAVMP